VAALKLMMKKRTRKFVEPPIAADPDVCGGVPRIRGTRIPVYVILNFLSAGTSVKRLLTQVPQLEVRIDAGSL
jgi:uncharacterized protein (DUF433 family)